MRTIFKQKTGPVEGLQHVIAFQEASSIERKPKTDYSWSGFLWHLFSSKAVLDGNLLYAKTYCTRTFQLIVQNILVIRPCTIYSG